MSDPADTTRDRKALAIATDLATHHRLCESHSGKKCDCYANAGRHYLGFAYLALVAERDALENALREIAYGEPPADVWNFNGASSGVEWAGKIARAALATTGPDDR
jgi:hypothetical protein